MKVVAMLMPTMVRYAVGDDLNKGEVIERIEEHEPAGDGDSFYYDIHLSSGFMMRYYGCAIWARYKV